MSPLHAALDEYLASRRALGHKLCRSGHLLQQFVAFADDAGATCITTDLAVAWATLPRRAQPADWARRLSAVRGFAGYCSALDPRNTVPPTGMLPHASQGKGARRSDRRARRRARMHPASLIGAVGPLVFCGASAKGCSLQSWALTRRHRRPPWRVRQRRVSSSRWRARRGPQPASPA